MANSKYQPLADYLKSKPGDRWDACFEDIERVLRRPLPRSAYQYQAWWANQTGPGHSQTHGWKSAGWRTARLDLERQRVSFERDGGERRIATPTEPDIWVRAREATGIADRSELIEAGLQALVQREAAERLVALGGSMPDYETPARERPAG